VIHLGNMMRAALQEAVAGKDDCYLHLAQSTYAGCHPDGAYSIRYSGRRRRSSWGTGNRTCCFASDSISAHA
jgi:hypothetical protein